MPPLSSQTLMLHIKMAFIFHGMEELMAAGIKSAKINNSVITCTLSSAFKIHASWDFPNLEMCAFCWWSRTVNSPG